MPRNHFAEIFGDDDSDLDEDDDDRRTRDIVPDGGRVRVAMSMMDGNARIAQRALTADASRRAYNAHARVYGGHRPGSWGGYTADDDDLIAAQAAAAEAREERDSAIRNAWREPVPFTDAPATGHRRAAYSPHRDDERA